MAQLTVQPITNAGSAAAYGPATAAGDSFPAGPASTFRVKNGSAAAITVTIASPGVCSHGGTHPTVAQVPAGGETDFGPFPHQRWADSHGLVHVTYSAVASVTVAAFSLPS